MVCGLGLETRNNDKRQRRGKKENKKAGCRKTLLVDLWLSVHFMNQGEAQWVSVEPMRGQVKEGGSDMLDLVIPCCLYRSPIIGLQDNTWVPDSSGCNRHFVLIYL